MSFKLHQQLASDCHLLGHTSSGELLLHKNALLPWFIFVPHTELNEIYKLESELKLQVQSYIDQLAKFVETKFSPDKINIATIGNIVPQLHIHVIARYQDDFCWPAPVWGQSESSSYTDSKLESIKNDVKQAGLITA